MSHINHKVKLGHRATADIMVAVAHSHNEGKADENDQIRVNLPWCHKSLNLHAYRESLRAKYPKTSSVLLSINSYKVESEFQMCGGTVLHRFWGRGVGVLIGSHWRFWWWWCLREPGFNFEVGGPKGNWLEEWKFGEVKLGVVRIEMELNWENVAKSKEMHIYYVYMHSWVVLHS